MNFEIKRIDDISIFKLNEKRLDTNISGLVKGEFTMLLKVEGVTKLILDLSEIETCDSSGLSAILVANRILNTTGGQMRLAAPSAKVNSLIKITQLDRVLPVCATVNEAFDELKKYRYLIARKYTRLYNYCSVSYWRGSIWSTLWRQTKIDKRLFSRFKSSPLVGSLFFDSCRRNQHFNIYIYSGSRLFNKFKFSSGYCRLSTGKNSCSVHLPARI